MVTDSRKCEQCGVAFAPRREHARFCSARCRVAWNRLHARESPAEGGALDWTITAMRETVDRLLRARGWDRPHAFAVISEAVWWVTMVDATLVRYHPDAYDGVLAGHDAAERRAIEGTFGGLRFVRNEMGYYLDQADFVQPGRGGPGAGAIAAWTWRSLPEPGLDSLPARGQEWEMTRYREYQAWLAGQPVSDTFRRAAAFLAGPRRAASRTASPAVLAAYGADRYHDGHDGGFGAGRGNQLAGIGQAEPGTAAPMSSTALRPWVVCRGQSGRGGPGPARRPRRSARGRLSRGRGRPGWWCR